MSGEGSRSTRFATRNARWAHNHRVTWLADGGASEDLAVYKQQTNLPPYEPSSLPYGNGNGYGNGHDGNGHYASGHDGNGHYANGHDGNGHNGNGNGHSYAGNGHNGNGKKLT